MKKDFLRRKLPRIAAALALAIVVYHFTLGNHGVSGRVVDAETGQPIEGAVALCVWIEPRWGVEITHHVVAVSESVSDKDGRIRAGGTWRMFLDPPELTIYKRGYVAWNNQEVFVPLSEYKKNPDLFTFKRTDFSWKSGFVAKMEKWKDGYSFNEHEAFVANNTAGARTKTFAAAMDWERLEQVKENDRIGVELRRKGLRK